MVETPKVYPVEHAEDGETWSKHGSITEGTYRQMLVKVDPVTKETIETYDDWIMETEVVAEDKKNFGISWNAMRIKR